MWIPLHYITLSLKKHAQVDHFSHTIKFYHKLLKKKSTALHIIQSLSAYFHNFIMNEEYNVLAISCFSQDLIARRHQRPHHLTAVLDKSKNNKYLGARKKFLGRKTFLPREKGLY